MVDEQTSDLRNSETRQRTILETMNDGVITLSKELLIKNTNFATNNIFGYSEEELIDKPINFLVTGLDDNKDHFKCYQEVEGHHKDHHPLPIEITLNEMDIDGVSMYTGIVRDITERKRAEKIKNEFVSTVSHELRTPLTSIRGSLGLVTGGVLGEIPEKAQDLLKTANRNTERLMNLINDLLDIQKIEAGKLEYSFSQVEVMDVIEKSVTDNLGYAEQYGVNIQLGDRADNVIVNTDPHRLSQIMANLISNAAKFSLRNGIVTIHSSIDDKFAKISVVDKGEGIPAEFHEKIFSKFSQNDSSATRQKGGTGLGLSITKKMIEKMGGKIDFTSIIGEGTTFNVYLPLENNN